MAAPRQQKGVVSVDLWVRAGVDGARNGGDPLCQQTFMLLYIKAERAESMLEFRVKTTNPAKPDEEFHATGLRQVPALVAGEDAIETAEDIAEYVDARFPHPTLHYFDPDADAATQDLFLKFCYYIKGVDKDSKALDAALRRVNEHLAENKTDYLTGNALTHLDCRVLPVLQHIRIAGSALLGYSISPELSALWQYMLTAYNTDAFIKCCSSDQEIILHWADRADTPNLTPSRRAELAREEPIVTADTPLD